MVSATSQLTDSVFVGRERELSELVSNLEEAKSGNGKLVVVEGEAGIGKTRLVQELARKALEDGVEVAYGRCLSLQQTDPYAPFMDALGDKLGMKEVKTDEDQLPLGLMGMGEAANGAYGSTGGLPMGLIPMAESPDSDLSRIDIQSERDKLFNRVLDVIIDSSKETPMMLFIDDLQWADQTTLQLLFYLARNITEDCVLLCAAYRSEEVEKLNSVTPFARMHQQVGRSITHQRIVLERMPEEEIGEIIKNLVGVKDVPDRFLNKLYEESRGNPFFVEEVVKSLMDEGIILRHGHIWDRGVDLAQIRIPNTIKDVITHRIARLDEDEKRVLRYASVIGDRYTFDVLKEVTVMKEEELLDSLDTLMEADIINEVTGSQEEEFVFGHKVTRSVVYDGMSKSRVRLMHKSTGDIIEKLYTDNIDPWVYELSRHFILGKSFPEAYKYTIMAGDKAFRGMAFEEAANYYISALRTVDLLPPTENVDRDAEKLNLSTSIGALLLHLAMWSDAAKYYETALSLARKKEDEKEESRILIALGHSQRLQSNYSKAMAHYEEAAKLADKLGDAVSMAEIQRGLGYVHWRKGENDDAVDHYNQSISFAMKAGDMSSMAKTFIELGNVYNHWGEQEKAIEYYNKSLEELVRLNDYPELARAYNNLGDSFLRTKEWDKAIEHFDKCKEFADKIGNKHMVAWARFNSAEALAYTGDLDKAEQYCREAMAICEAQDDKIGMQATFANYGIIYRLKEEWEKSIENFNKAIVILEMLDIPYELGDVYFDLGITYETMGENAAALDNYKMAKDLFTNVGAKSELKSVDDRIKNLDGK
jgi:predicted ATPase